MQVKQHAGHLTFTLIVDGVKVKVWASNPGEAYCKDAIYEAMKKGTLSVQRGVGLLMQTSNKRAIQLEPEEEPEKDYLSW